LEKKINKIGLFLLKSLISFFLIYFVLKKAGIGNILLLIKNINFLYFFTSVGLYILTIYISTLRWHLLTGISSKHPIISIKKLFSLYMIGCFFNTMLPGVISGDTLRIYYLYKETGNSKVSFGSPFLDRYTGYAGMLFIGLIGFSFSYKFIKYTPIKWVIPSIVIAFIIGSFIVFSLKIGKKFSVLENFYDYIIEFFKMKYLILKSFSLSVLIQFIVIISVYVIAKGIKAEVSLLELFFFLPIIATITTIPISISGIGVRESAFMLLFGTVGIKPEVAATISFTWFLSYVIGSLPGAIFYLKWKSVN